MKHIFHIILLAITVLKYNVVVSQENSIYDVLSIKLQDIGPILKDSEVTGYYMFYKTDKLSKDTSSYVIDILDQNLNILISKPINGSDQLKLLDGVYNNKTLLLKFYDYLTKEITLSQYDNGANEISKVIRKLSSYESYIIERTFSDNGGQNVCVFPLEKTGFVDYRGIKNKKYGYNIDLYSSTDSNKIWTLTSEVKSKLHEFATHIYGDKNVIVSSILSKKTLLTRSIDISILAINAKTGEKMFEKPIVDPNYELLVLNGLESDLAGNIYLLGNYFPKGKSELNNPSLGIFTIKLDIQGNIIEKNFISWEEDIGKLIDVNNYGKIKDGGYVYFHDFVRDANGNIYAIGEQFKKRNKFYETDMIIGDLLIIELDKNATLKNVNVIDNEKFRIVLPEGMGINGPQILSYYIKSKGWFNFQFIEFNRDQSIFSIGYYERNNNKDSFKLDFGITTYADGELSQDRINLLNTNENKMVRVLPAKIGNIAIIEYLIDEKLLKMRIEKINY